MMPQPGSAVLSGAQSSDPRCRAVGGHAIHPPRCAASLYASKICTPWDFFPLAGLRAPPRPKFDADHEYALGFFKG